MGTLAAEPDAIWAMYGRAETALSRAGPVIVFMIGALAIWLPPRPPMIDLPQFAGQIALLKGLLTGTTPWAAMLRIDALTPYLLGYAVTLPLAFVLPITVSLKIVLTAALAALGLAAAAIRRALGASRALDAYALIGFFGFDYAWGLVTFLIAAPLGLAVVWLTLRYVKSPTALRAWILLSCAMLLLFAHALVLLFVVGVGLILVATRTPNWGLRRAILRAWPLAAPLAGGMAMYLVANHGSGAGGAPASAVDFGPWLLRLLGPLAAIDDRPAVWTIVAFIALAALPFVGGLRFRARPIERTIIAGAVAVALAAAPDGAWLASGVYRRFALFAPAAWAWMFDDVETPAGGLARAVRPHLSLAAAALAGLILVQHVVEGARFGREDAGFEKVLAAARPGQRALGLVIDEASAADVDLHVYWHFPLWYQAERNGLVDPSFAAGAPSIVRYRTNPAGLTEAFNVDRGTFNWRADQGAQWTYFFVRAPRVPPRLFAGAECPPALVAARGEWALYERRACHPPNP